MKHRQFYEKIDQFHSLFFICSSFCAGFTDTLRVYEINAGKYFGKMLLLVMVIGASDRRHNHHYHHPCHLYRLHNVANKNLNRNYSQNFNR